MPLIHSFTHTFTHQRRSAAMQGTNQLVRSNWGLGVLLRDTSTRPGWDRTGSPPTARRQLLPPEPYRPTSNWPCTPNGFPNIPPSPPATQDGAKPAGDWTPLTKTRLLTERYAQVVTGTRPRPLRGLRGSADRDANRRLVSRGAGEFGGEPRGRP